MYKIHKHGGFLQSRSHILYIYRGKLGGRGMEEVGVGGELDNHPDSNSSSLPSVSEMNCYNPQGGQDCYNEQLRTPCSPNSAPQGQEMLLCGSTASVTNPL